MTEPFATTSGQYRRWQRSKIIAMDERLHNLVTLHYDGTNEIVVPFAPEPFNCLIWDHCLETSTETMDAVGHALVRAGCVYFVCAGNQCERWHDMTDSFLVWDEIMGIPNGKLAEHICTTWHTDELVEEVAFNLVQCTGEENRLVVLHIGHSSLVEALNRSVEDHLAGRVGF